MNQQVHNFQCNCKINVSEGFFFPCDNHASLFCIDHDKVYANHRFYKLSETLTLEKIVSVVVLSRLLMRA